MASGNTLAIFLPANNEPPSTNYATLAIRNGHPVLNFDTTTQETAIFTGIIPRHYGNGGITVYVTWAAATATSGTIGWDVTFELMNTIDLDADDWATAQTITAATVSGAAGNPSTTNVAITAGGTGTDSVAAGNTFRLRIRRDVATDTAAGDGQILSVEVKET